MIRVYGGDGGLMAHWIALMSFAATLALLAAMPWKRSHSNHCFMLALLESALAEIESERDNQGSKTDQQR